MKKENQVLSEVRRALSNFGVTAFRNNVGAYKDPKGYYVQYGLCKGSSDLIGWKTIEITEEMVGNKFAVFVAVECKAESGGNIRPEQTNFLQVVQKSGGIAGIARSESDAFKIIMLGPKIIT